MSSKPRRPLVTVGRRLKAAVDALAGRSFVLLIKLIRRLDRRRMANLAAKVTRTFGPWLKEHRLGRENLAAAFPEKSAAEIEAILAGVWDNLGRVAAEFAHLDRLHILDPARPGAEDIVYDEHGFDVFHRLRLDDKPALLFTAHLANWELTAYVAAAYQLPLHILYRRPNIRAVDDAVREARVNLMGTLVPTGLDAPVRLVRVLEEGGHVGMLVDQHFVRGVDVTFFGRRCKANPLIAQLVRLVECPVHGVRVVRLPGLDRFRLDITEEITPARDADGKVDIEGTMQVITSVVEGWVREHPEQWLWVHRRWR
ncbi:MAG TPA: lipid A biosynthesis lauroyl acyltransferase [Bradyrhizobium sp.]|nr:lipid A biosynthesis lauroyl acyltransferase [Bradyrhizobium sp.]